MNSLPDFETKNLAEAIEALTAEKIDQLPFGVIGIDPEGIVRVFSKTEASQSGYGSRLALGTFFFIDVAPCMNNNHFKGRIDKARAAGTLNISFTFIGDFEDLEPRIIDPCSVCKRRGHLDRDQARVTSS